ncbi:M50 family metallopeptidase [Brevibacterium litoralis]|uniref:M50 family metallopeptidase n=1 Tax=Brevibacterium litoralis TaxID=3138935 RepID=UPI0032EE9635
MTTALYLLGVLLFLVGIGVSIALHELGHLVPAKRFGVKVTQYMVGFGPTLFSRRKGDTEYGVKLLPLGGYIAMPGMYPPEEVTGARSRGRGFFSRAMADAREYSNEQIAPGEEHRTFYALSVPKRLVVMFGGPLVNLVLGIGIMAVVLMGIGVLTPTPTVQTVVECAVPASEADRDCTADDPRTPAWEVGIEPGDRITAIDGVPIPDWDTLGSTVEEAAGTTVPVVVDRGGEELTFDVPVMETERVVTDEDGFVVYTDEERTEPATEITGFLGIQAAQEYRGIPAREFPGEMWGMITQTFHALLTLPQKLVDVGRVAFTDEERDPEGAIGVVGVGRIAGEVVSTDQLDLVEKASTGLSLLGGLNLFLFAFNMVPLLPLDGGHIAVGLYEGARRRINLWRGSGTTGPFDTARLLPLTYVMVGLMLCMTALLVWVDLFEPVRLFAE